MTLPRGLTQEGKQRTELEAAAEGVRADSRDGGGVQRQHRLGIRGGFAERKAATSGFTTRSFGKRNSCWKEDAECRLEVQITTSQPSTAALTPSGAFRSTQHTRTVPVSRSARFCL